MSKRKKAKRLSRFRHEWRKTMRSLGPGNAGWWTQCAVYAIDKVREAPGIVSPSKLVYDWGKESQK